MNILIIPNDKVEKIKSMVFPKGNMLEPQLAILNNQEVYWLQANLLDEPIFNEAYDIFLASEQIEISSIEQKYFKNDIEILPTKEIVDGIEITKYYDNGVEVNIFELIPKSFLNI